MSPAKSIASHPMNEELDSPVMLFILIRLVFLCFTAHREL
ncbi:hypothetical protein HMPREF0496_1870 [Lentilactobacillus hilgardii ATCC 27305]|nr:hypothetical protein HMPREF0496_1870 [Lentilactobacillus hilgardii ATCC 27305]